MGSIVSSELDKALDALVGNATYTASAGFYVQLHTGDPGGSGTSNVATESTRQAASMASASGGAITNDADVEWTDVAATEDITYISLWTASSSGTFLGSDDITTASLTAGDTFRIPTGDLDITIS